MASTLCAVGEGRTVSDCLFRESGKPVHKVFAGFGDRHALWTVGVQRGAWEFYLGAYGRVSMRRAQSTIRKIHAGTLLKCAPEQLRHPSERAGQLAHMGQAQKLHGRMKLWTDG